MIKYVIRLKLNTTDLLEVIEKLKKVWQLESIIDFKESDLIYSKNLNLGIVDIISADSLIFLPETHLNLLQDAAKVYYIEYVIAELNYNEPETIVTPMTLLTGTKQMVRLRHSNVELHNQQILDVIYNDNNEYIIKALK